MDTKSVSPFLQRRLRDLEDFLRQRALQSKTAVKVPADLGPNGQPEDVPPASDDLRPREIGGG